MLGQVSVRTDYCNNRAFTMGRMFMRCFTIMLVLLTLTACGKTGALYLPEEEPVPAPQTEPVPAPQAEPAPSPDAESSGETD